MVRVEYGAGASAGKAAGCGERRAKRMGGRRQRYVRTMSERVAGKGGRDALRANTETGSGEAGEENRAAYGNGLDGLRVA